MFSALVLFDIDGTLVRRAGPQHKDAMIEAVWHVTELETSVDGIPLYGMLDPDIVTGMLRSAGATRAEIRVAMPEILRKAQAIYLQKCPPTLSRHTCPGVRNALRRLEKHGALLGLVTGNLTAIGWKKMELAGLRDFFRFGAFGEMGSTRGRLAKLAIARARKEGWIDRAAPISLVGDAPADIEAAKQAGARSIAVCTGVVPAERLKTFRPDLLLKDLRELQPGMVL
jgi:phosphoglycolate phosphatase-like HAD superfamily hydrolase